MYPSQKADRMNLRLPDGLRSAISERARQNRRSANSEAIFLLELAMNVEAEKPSNKSAPESAGTLSEA